VNPEDFYTDPEGLAEATERSNFPQEFLNIRDRFIEQFEPGDRILDSGCGPGHDVAYFEQNGLEAVGVDVSSEMVEYVEQRELEAVESDMKHLDFDDNSFDGVWCCASIHFNNPDGMRDAAEELYRVTEKGGLAQITFKLGEKEFYVNETGESSIRHYLVSENKAYEIVESAGYEINEELSGKNNPDREEFDYFLNVFAEKPEK